MNKSTLKTILLVSVLIIAAVLFCACGGGGVEVG